MEAQVENNVKKKKRINKEKKRKEFISTELNH